LNTPSCRHLAGHARQHPGRWWRFGGGAVVEKGGERLRPGFLSLSRWWRDGWRKHRIRLSGLGINPHYGTPGNPYDRQTDSGRILIGCGSVGERWWRGGRDRNGYRWFGSHPSRALRQPIPAEGLRLGVPQSYVLDGLAPEVAGAFAADAPFE